MNVKILEIALGEQVFGKLFQYADLCRFVAEPAVVAEPPSQVMSLSMLATDRAAQSALWRDLKNPLFNAQDGKLPAFFQNLLPEGVLRTHIAQLRGCRDDDHFELLAACGGDLPGAVSARPVNVDRATLQRLVTQDQDALEMSVVELPMPQGISVSGVQPKLGLRRQGGRYVARTRAGKSTRVIAKLPVGSMPQLEAVARPGRRCRRRGLHAELAPMAAIDAEHSYALLDEPEFLADALRPTMAAGDHFSRTSAQVLAVDPQDKSTPATSTSRRPRASRFSGMSQALPSWRSVCRREQRPLRLAGKELQAVSRAAEVHAVGDDVVGLGQLGPDLARRVDEAEVLQVRVVVAQELRDLDARAAARPRRPRPWPSAA